MFDQLIQSNPHAAAKQAGYLGITSLIYSALLIAIMVWSVFSFDLSGLNEGDLAFNELVAPVAVPENVPPPVVKDQPEPKAAAAPNAPRNYDEIRNPVKNIINSTAPPDNVSMVKSDTTPIRDNVPYIVSNRNIRGGSADGVPDRTNNAVSSALPIAIQSKEITKEEIAPQSPPRPMPAPVVKNQAPVSKGVINGIATSLPKPAYPSPARAIHASGEVKVQVLIDERGNVVSATAVSGHSLLRAAAQTAARNAKFTPTQLSNQPVKVTGVIIYNFVAQ